MSAWWRAAAKTHRSFHLMSHKVAPPSTICVTKWRLLLCSAPSPPLPPLPPFPGYQAKGPIQSDGYAASPRPSRRVGAVRGGRCYTSVPCLRSPEIESPQRAFRSRPPAEPGATAYTAAQMPLNPRATNHAQPTTRTQSRALNHAHSPSGSEDLQVFHGMSHQVAHLPPFCHRSTSGIVTAGGLLR